jgi:hypothetical protein
MARNRIGSLDPTKLRELARAGAELTLRTLRAEIAAIERAFPELDDSPRRRRSVATSALARGSGKGQRRKRRMSAAARRAVSKRMKRYWAERRKAQRPRK